MFSRIVYILLFLLLPTLSIAQTDNDDFLSQTFKAIARKDQSNLDNPEKRQAIFIINFELIQTLLRDSINLNTQQQQQLKKRTNKRLHLGLTLTFIHVMQVDPHLLMNDETSDFFAQHLQQKTIDSKELKIALAAYQTDVENDRTTPEFAKYYTERIVMIKRKWGMN